MKNYEIITEVRGLEKILVIKQGQDKYLNDYLTKMLEYNSIYGILPLKSQSMNGSMVLNYFVGERYRLVDSIKQNQLGSKEACVIYNRLVDILTGIGEYFLNVDQLVYDLDYLYIDSTLNPYMLYIPFENVRDMEINRTWREFFLELLSYFSAGMPEPFYDKLMRYLIQPNFSLSEFRGFLAQQPLSEGVQITSVQEQMLQSRTSSITNTELNQSQDIATSKVFMDKENKPLTMPEGLETVNPVGKMAIPGKRGRNVVAIPGVINSPGDKALKVKPEKENKEKKNSSLFGFMKKKEDTKADVEAAQVPARKQEQISGDVQLEQEQTSEKWSKTVYIKPVQVDNHTVMLNAVRPHLENRGVSIPIGQYPFTIGKANASYIVANPTVSRLHATISEEGNNYYITDENSSNGTYLNGQLLEKKRATMLSDGDRLLLSDEEFTFHTK